jgi:uncharacterized membrane protein YraQ (UPF0718 family)
MILIALTVLLYGVVALLLWLAWRRQDGSAPDALRSALREVLHLMPRLALGVIGSGFLAAALPQETVVGWFGGSSGAQGVALAALAGALTPGGPVVGYAVGSAALKAGAGLPQVMAFVTGWSLFTLNRMLIWEQPFLPGWFLRTRLIASAAMPFIIAGLVAALQAAGRL